jgi:hypothetical protein
MDEKVVRNLDQDARAVACFWIATRGAAMGKVDENLEALADDVMALFAAYIGDQPHAAGIVLIARMIEALRRRNAETTIRCMHGNPLR